MKTAASRNLIRSSGLSAVAAALFVFVQLIHQPDLLSSVSTRTWVVVHSLSVAMCILWLLGLTGLYARQAQESGWPGVAGYLLTSAFLVLTAAFTFAEAFILPVVVSDAAGFVESFLAIERGAAGQASVGALAALYTITGALYLLGGVLFGIATFRARVLPWWAGAVLAVGTVLPVAFSVLLPHEFLRTAAFPVGVALVWLGWALWSERREPRTQLFLPPVARSSVRRLPSKMLSALETDLLVDAEPVGRNHALRFVEGEDAVTDLATEIISELWTPASA